jgi:hypothetical protein
MVPLNDVLRNPTAFGELDTISFSTFTNGFFLLAVNEGWATFAG